MHSKRGFSSRVGTGISPKPSSNRICRFPFLLFRQRIDIRTSVLPSPEGETNITPGEEHAVRRNPGYRPTPRSAPGGRHCRRSSKCGCQCISKCVHPQGGNIAFPHKPLGFRFAAPQGIIVPPLRGSRCFGISSTPGSASLRQGLLMVSPLRGCQKAINFHPMG